MVGRLYTQYSRSEIYGFEMIKIEYKTGRRILIGGRDLPLAADSTDNVSFWYIYTKEEVIPGLFSKAESTLSCFLKRVENTLIPPIEVACIAFTWGTSMMLRIYGMNYSYYTQMNVKREDI